MREVADGLLSALLASCGSSEETVRHILSSYWLDDAESLALVWLVDLVDVDPQIDLLVLVVALSLDHLGLILDAQR